MVSTTPHLQNHAYRWHLAGIAVLVALELAAIGTVFKHGIDFACLENWPKPVCRGASISLAATYCLFGALLVFAMLLPEPLKNLISDAGGRRWPVGLNLVGALIAFLPILILREGAGTEAIPLSLAAWAVGLLMILGGAALYVASPGQWRTFLRDHWRVLLTTLALGVAAPFLATLARPLWKLETIADATFVAVTRLIRIMGYDISSDTEEKTIGSGDFFIRIAPECSGIEGLLLVTLFVTLYLTLFHKELRFPRALLLYPVGIAASMIFNVLRISVLLAIGFEGNPDLAVGGFHSHAGWLTFTLVSLGIIALAQTIPALRRNSDQRAQPAEAVPPFFRDPNVARILPFAVFMFSALLANVFVEAPGAVYPLRMLAVLAILAPFASIYLRLNWSVSATAVCAGVAVGLMWILIPVAPADGAPPYGALSGALLVGWFIMRGFGTIVLVPIIEELFFRGYLETRLRLGNGTAWRVFAAVVTAGLFAALHDRWAEAFLAGLVFSWVLSRRNSVVDAIVAHMAANALVFATAVATGNLAII